MSSVKCTKLVVRHMKPISRIRIMVLIAVMVICAGCASASAGGKPNDGASTAAYLRARNGLLQKWMTTLAAGQGPMEEYVSDVRAECEGVLRDAPVTTKLAPVGSIRGLTNRRLAQAERATFLYKLTEEGLEYAQRLPQLAAGQRFASRIAALRWSDPAVTDLVHSYASIENHALRSQPQNICARAREWVKDGYGSPPSLSTLSLRRPSQKCGTELTKY